MRLVCSRWKSPPCIFVSIDRLGYLPSSLWKISSWVDQVHFSWFLILRVPLSWNFPKCYIFIYPFSTCFLGKVSIRMDVIWESSGMERVRVHVSFSGFSSFVWRLPSAPCSRITPCFDSVLTKVNGSQRGWFLNLPFQLSRSFWNVSGFFCKAICSCEIFLTIPFAAPHNFGFFGSPQSFW